MFYFLVVKIGSGQNCLSCLSVKQVGHAISVYDSVSASIDPSSWPDVCLYKICDISV